MNQPEKKPRRRVKKVKGHGDHHGGAWKVAYADFVTAMMALFLVLWLVSQADTKLKQAIANYFRSPGVFSTMKGGVLEGPKKVSKEPSAATSKDEEQALFSTSTMLEREFSTRPEFSKYKDQIKIDITEQGLRIQILDKADHVSFGSGSADLNQETRSILAEIAHGICGLPNPLLIGGHTDRHLFPPDSTYTNWELSADRANAARRELEANCVKPEQIYRIVGYADTDLLVPEDPYAPANRRISITVLRMNGAAAAGPGEAPKETGATGEKQIPVKAQASDKMKVPASSPSHPSAPTDERRLSESKLASEGSVSVGEKDTPPANVQHVRAPAPNHQ